MEYVYAHLGAQHPAELLNAQLVPVNNSGVLH